VVLDHQFQLLMIVIYFMWVMLVRLVLVWIRPQLVILVVQVIIVQKDHHLLFNVTSRYQLKCVGWVWLVNLIVLLVLVWKVIYYCSLSGTVLATRQCLTGYYCPSDTANPTDDKILVCPTGSYCNSLLDQIIQ
jgi:hypothetical protein